MRNSTWSNVVSGALVLLLAAIVVLMFFATVGSIVTHIDGRDAAEAKCRSVNGSSGGGKCFKDGKEI